MGGPRAPKRTQHCTFCKNHGLNTPKKGHHCPHLECPCLLCKLTKKAQMAMRHQQRVWRHQKQKLKSQKFDTGSAAPENKTNKSQACDKCRNHNTLIMKRNHQCPYQTCQCEYCSLTFKRREIMKHQQRVRRSRITSQIEAEASPAAEEPLEENEHQYSCYKEEEEEEDEEAPCGRPGKRCPDRHENSNEARTKKIKLSTPAMGNREISMNEPPQISAVPMGTLVSRFSPMEIKQYSPHQPPHDPFETKIHEPHLREESRSLSPPPLIHMSNRPSPIQTYSRGDRSVSPQSHFDPSSPKLGSPRIGDDSPPIRGDLYHEELQENPHPAPPLILFPHRSSSTSSSSSSSSPSSCFRSFPFPSSQPLQSLSALNASLGPSMNSIKFGAHLEDFHLRNCNWLPSALIGSSLGNISQTTASLLHSQQQQQQQQQHHLSHHHRPIRPLPLNMSRPPHPGSLSHHFWNPMFLSLNLGLQQSSSSEINLDRFHGIAGSSRFSS